MKPQLKLVSSTKTTTSTLPSAIEIQKGLRIKRRGRSNYWQVYIAVKGKKPIRESTGTEDVATAKQVALQKLAEVQYKLENNLPTEKRTFGNVAKAFIVDCERLVKVGEMKPATYSFYKQTVDNYFLPFFDVEQNKKIEGIGRVAITQFQKWRIENGKTFADGVRCKPSSATLNKEETVLNRLLEFAIDNEYISQKPDIKKTKVVSNRHPHFTKTEFRRLVRMLRQFIEASPNGNIRKQRSLMYSAIIVLVKTGLRPHELLPDTDKKTKGLKWANVVFDTDRKTKKKFVKLDIVESNSKTKARDVFAGATAYWHLKRLYEKADTRWLKIEKIFNSDFRRSFNTFLTWANMRTNAEGEKYCMYSLRHSFATWKIEDGVSIQQLAEVMGNSPNIIHKHYSHAMTANFKENFI